MSEYDVVVVGGGMSGCISALTAARLGAEVLIVERSEQLGGVAANAWVTPWQTFHSPRGRVVGGLPQELVEKLTQRGACLGHVPDPIGFAPSLTPVEPSEVGPLLRESMGETGVEVLTETELASLERFGAQITGLQLEGVNSGKQLHVKTQAAVDATGSAFLARLCELPTELDPSRQPASLLFRMSGVDELAVIEHIKSHPDNFVTHPNPEVLDQGYLAVAGFFDEVEQARESGELELNRDRLLFFATPSQGEVIVNTTRLDPPPSDNPGDERYQEYYDEGVAQVERLSEWMIERIPGFEEAELDDYAQQLGIRESFRLVGEYQLDQDDVLGAKSFPDEVARGSFPIDIHGQDDEMTTQKVGGTGDYGIPVRCLYHREVRNLVVVGKCISATHAAFASSRTIPTAMALGQAGGGLAALVGRGMMIDSEDIYELWGERMAEIGHIWHPGQIEVDELTRRFLSPE